MTKHGSLVILVVADAPTDVALKGPRPFGRYPVPALILVDPKSEGMDESSLILIPTVRAISPLRPA